MAKTDQLTEKLLIVTVQTAISSARIHGMTNDNIATVVERVLRDAGFEARVIA